MTVQVGKLTVRTAQRGAGRDAGFRVRTESRLRSLDLYPPGLPDRAVLVVRRMDLARVDGSTARRTRAALAGLRQGAPRPAAGPVGASANAVLFGDEVELLACLTADLADGVASRRWYWRAVLPAASAEGGTALAAAWMSRIRWLPASLARLPEPEARSAVSLLSRPDTSRVLQALLAAFGVEEHPALRSPPGPPDPAEPLAAPDQPAPAGRRLADPPWRRWLPATSLHPQAEALLGVALSLHHAPAIVRRPSYAERLAAWRGAPGDASWPQAPAEKAARPGGPPGTASPGPGQSITASPGTVSPGTAPSTGPPPAQAGQGTGPLTSAPSAEVRTVAESPAVLADAGTPRHAPTAVPARAAHAQAAGCPEASGALAPGQPPVEPPGTDDVASHGTWTPADDGIATGLASLLFLVNFAVWLDDTDDAVGPAGWALVELLGRHLLGAQLSDYADDPLWDVLAELDGRRPGTPPAVELGSEDPLRLPQAWLRRWPPPHPTYVARQSGEQLVIRHPEAGFVAADVRCPPSRLDEVCAAEAALLGGAEIIMAAQGPAAGAAPPPEQRFGDAVGAFVSWLLRSRAIGVSSLAAPGRVLVTATHVDVVLSLQHVDLAARVAGLDRDPGWVPALGRIVLFHFLEAP